MRWWQTGRVIDRTKVLARGENGDRFSLRGGEIDLLKRTFSGPAGHVGLTQTEVGLLRYFYEHRGQAIPREDLLREVWGYRSGVVTRAVDHAIKRLRRKIEVAPGDPDHILTLHGVGYRFELSTNPEDRSGRKTSVVLRGEMGRGAQGVVYRAEVVREDGLMRDLAVKKLFGELVGHPSAARRLEDEARVLAKLVHHHIVQFHGLVYLEGDPALLMERVDGIDLQKALASGPLPCRVAVEIVGAVADALHAAFSTSDLRSGKELRIVHGDVKPGNILVSRHGGLKVTDFGIARFGARKDASSEQIQGTVRYLGPEVWNDGHAGHSTDVYALGITLLVLLGFPSRPGPRNPEEHRLWVAEVTGAISEGVPAPLIYELPVLVAGMLAYEPADRPRASVVRDRCLILADCLTGERLGSWARVIVPELQVDRSRGVSGASPPPSSEPSGSSKEGPFVRHSRRGVILSADSFLGRGELLRRLGGWPEGRERILTLTGPAGVGKTRLARELAHGWFTESRVPICFTGLRQARSAADVVDKLADALELSFPPRLDPAARRRLLMKNLEARGTCVIVLDNGEQIAAEIASVIEEVHDVVQLRWLITSQRRIGVRGEVVLPVPPLDLESSVALLCDRTGWVCSAMPSASQEQVRRLARRLDGLPLAIELAASRATLFSPGQLLERLEHRFSLLARRGSDADHPHRSLEAALEWSWGLLAPWHQGAMRQCTVFRGGFTLEAAEEVLDLSGWATAPEVSWVLQELVEASLLGVSDDQGSRRLGLLRAVRDFASDRAEESEREHAIRRHGDFFSSRASAMVEAALSDPTGRAVSWIADEQDNVRAAFDRSVASGSPRSEALGLVLARLSLRNGPLARCLEVLDLVDKVPVPFAGWRQNRLRATALWKSGRAEEARVLMRAELEREGHGSDAGAVERAHVRSVLGVASGLCGDLEESVRLIAEAAELFRGEGRLLDVANCESNLGMALHAGGRVVEALHSYQRSYEGYVLEKNLDGQARLLGNLAGVRLDLGLEEEAERSYRMAIEWWRRVDSRWGLCNSLNDLAGFLASLERLSEARKLLEEALGLAVAAGFEATEATSRVTLAMVALEEGELIEAEEHLVRIPAQPKEPRLRGTVEVLRVRLDRKRGGAAGLEDRLRGAETLLAAYPIETRLLSVERGWVQLLMGDLDGARDTSRELRSGLPSNERGEPCGRFSDEVRKLEAACT